MEVWLIIQHHSLCCDTNFKKQYCIKNLYTRQTILICGRHSKLLSCNEQNNCAQFDCFKKKINQVCDSILELKKINKSKILEIVKYFQDKNWFSNQQYYTIYNIASLSIEQKNLYMIVELVKKFSDYDRELRPEKIKQYYAKFNILKKCSAGECLELIKCCLDVNYCSKCIKERCKMCNFKNKQMKCIVCFRNYSFCGKCFSLQYGLFNNNNNNNNTTIKICDKECICNLCVLKNNTNQDRIQLKYLSEMQKVIDTNVIFVSKWKVCKYEIIHNTLIKVILLQIKPCVCALCNKIHGIDDKTFLKTTINTNTIHKNEDDQLEIEWYCNKSDRKIIFLDKVDSSTQNSVKNLVCFVNGIYLGKKLYNIAPDTNYFFWLLKQQWFFKKYPVMKQLVFSYILEQAKAINNNKQ